MKPEPLRLKLPIKISYTVLRQLMDVKLMGMELGSKDRKYAKIIGIQLEVSPLPDYDVVLGLRIALHRKIVGFKEMPIYLHGSLQYDSVTEQLSIGTFKMDSKSRNFLLDKALEAFANRLYYRKILDAASVDMKELIRPQLVKLNQKLETGVSLVKGTQLYGVLEGLSVAALESFNDHITVHVLVSGTVEMTLKELPPRDFD
ncbi:DUF4403 family protein [Pareuzebyella sediminis]|uniref:DUF4403 family protein n=1 Tax=Pareuzebyella sediminis TaxID=2607998 RepID=UPI0011EE8E15|nr:DUF4403 family protein [Pareuzebyella sediminis]